MKVKGGWWLLLFLGVDVGGALLLAIAVLYITKIIPFYNPYIPSTPTFLLEVWGVWQEVGSWVLKEVYIIVLLDWDDYVMDSGMPG